MNRRRWITAGLLAGLLLAGGCGRLGLGSGKKLTQGPKYAHMVFFTLHNNTVYEKQKLVRDCYAYLRSHPGVVYCSAGERALSAAREVNDKDFDVALHIVFENTGAYDEYAVSKKHLQFIERNESNWRQVRVFDSLIQ